MISSTTAIKTAVLKSAEPDQKVTVNLGPSKAQVEVAKATVQPSNSQDVAKLGDILKKAAGVVTGVVGTLLPGPVGNLASAASQKLLASPTPQKVSSQQLQASSAPVMSTPIKEAAMSLTASKSMDDIGDVLGGKTKAKTMWVVIGAVALVIIAVLFSPFMRRRRR